MTGMRLSKLTDEILLEIFQIYDKVTGGDAMFFWEYSRDGRMQGLLTKNLPTGAVKLSFGSEGSEGTNLVVIGVYDIPPDVKDPVIFLSYDPCEDPIEFISEARQRAFELELEELFRRNHVAESVAKT